MIDTELNDQASGLRRLTKPPRTKVITVTGGKGGIGKTHITLSMAAAIAKQDKKVMVLDADLGLANADVLLGLRVRENLSHVMQGVCDLRDIILDGPHGMKIIPGASGVQAMTELTKPQHEHLIRAFSTLDEDVDILLVDTAAGISDMVLSFCHAAQDVVIIVCDEPTSITDAYALIKILNREYQISHFKVVANMVHNYQQGRELFAKLTRVTDRFLQAHLELVACVPKDEKIHQAIRKQKMVVDAYPSSPAALALNTLAKKVLDWPVPRELSGHLTFFVERLLIRDDAVGDKLGS